MDHHDYTYTEIRTMSCVCDLEVNASPNWIELIGSGPTCSNPGALHFEFDPGLGVEYLRRMAAVLLTAADEIERHQWID